MVDIIVDGKRIAVNEDGNLIDELAKHGIKIPHFCYHRELGVSGNCRMCLVEIKGKKRPQIACDMPIKEGMEVLIESKLTKYVQQAMMELELVNHPIDCPVCDQAGECSLQDYYMDYGLKESRIPLESKVSKEKKLDFGSDVMHDQERCVLCTRCIRFTSEYTKTNELGLFKRGDESRVMTFLDNKIDNRYAGNIIEICPVGAMTSKDFRFKQRVWDLKESASICQGCSRGCNIYIDHHAKKYDKDRIYRFRARENFDINGTFICDDGRYSYKKENQNRLETIKIDSNPASLDEAICEFEKLLQKKSVALVSPSLSFEELKAIQVFAKERGIYLSGFSDSLKTEDSDNLLILGDKSSNRASIEFLKISQNSEELLENLKEAEVIINFDSSELYENKKLFDISKTKELIEISSYLNLKTNASLQIPIASFSEKDGTYINFENRKQRATKAVDTKAIYLNDLLKKVKGS